jgi:hypothetical protein
MNLLQSTASTREQNQLDRASFNIGCLYPIHVDMFVDSECDPEYAQNVDGRERDAHELSFVEAGRC